MAGIAENIAVITAEQIERTAGPAAALAAYRPLIARLAVGDARDRAIVGAVRCAALSGDAVALAELVPWWSTARGDRIDAAVEIVRVLVAKGRAGVAAVLAAEEVDREANQREPRADYLLARCLEADGDHAAAMEAYARAAASADQAIDGAAIAFAARARRVARLFASAATRPEAIAEAALAKESPTSPLAERLIVARARLWSSSRFARAAALSTLEELARTGDRAVSERAVELAAEHADAMGDALSGVEIDRLRAVLRLVRDPGEREEALRRLDALARVVAAAPADRGGALREAASIAPELGRAISRAEALLAGVTEVGGLRLHRATEPRTAASAERERFTELGLDAVAALRKGEPLAAEVALSRASDLVADAPFAPPAVWTAARLGLASPRRGVQAVSARLCDALLSGGRSRPPRGFSELASALRRRGHVSLAARAWRAATEAREPGAPLELARERTIEGWSLAAKGEREAAVAALREAKALLANLPG